MPWWAVYVVVSVVAGGSASGGLAVCNGQDLVLFPKSGEGTASEFPKPQLTDYVPRRFTSIDGINPRYRATAPHG